MPLHDSALRAGRSGRSGRVGRAVPPPARES